MESEAHDPQLPPLSQGLAYGSGIEPESPLTGSEPTLPPEDGDGMGSGMLRFVDRMQRGGTPKKQRSEQEEKLLQIELNRQFFARNVAPTASYQYAYYGSFFDRDGRRVTHDFQVSMPEVTDGIGRPTVRVDERHIERKDGQPRMVQRNWDRLTIEVNRETRTDEQTRRAIGTYLDGWHRAYVRLALEV